MSSVTPRKQPVQQRSRATVDAIIEAGGQVLVSHGFAKATTHIVAKRAGVSVGTLYQYFGNKHSLFVEVMRRNSNQLLARLLAVRPAFKKLALPEAIAEVVKTMLGFFLEKPEIWRALIEHRAQLLPEEERHQRHRQAEKLISAALVERQETRGIEDFDMAAFLLLKTTEALTHAAIIERPHSLHDGSLEREIIRLFSGYLLGGKVDRKNEPPLSP